MKTNQQGFTLIELMVVIAIIAMLSSIVFVSLGNVRTKSRDVRRLSDIKQIQNALELYYADEGQYPPRNQHTSYSGVWTNNLAADLQPYLDPLPIDPINVSGPDYFAYFYDADDGDNYQSYGMMFRYEHPDNLDLVGKDGGYFSNLSVGKYLEFGDQPAYCMNAGYSGNARDWWSSDLVSCSPASYCVCRGGN